MVYQQTRIGSTNINHAQTFHFKTALGQQFPGITKGGIHKRLADSIPNLLALMLYAKIINQSIRIRLGRKIWSQEP